VQHRRRYLFRGGGRLPAIHLLGFILALHRGDYVLSCVFGEAHHKHVKPIMRETGMYFMIRLYASSSSRIAGAGGSREVVQRVRGAPPSDSLRPGQGLRLIGTRPICWAGQCATVPYFGCYRKERRVNAVIVSTVS